MAMALLTKLIMQARACRKWPVLALGATSIIGMTLMATLRSLDAAYPPPLDHFDVSTEVVDRNGALLRSLATPQGVWRFTVALDDVDPRFVDMLIAYEDRRFYAHRGIDLIAMGRAALQLVTNGRIVSGGSTISMQLARLIEPREKRSLSAKIRQMLRAVQIERRLGKDEILERYLTLAPYGGNLEGIRAATLGWYGKEPKRLLVSEAALLVALPQLPEQRRPDTNPVNALAARDRVLERMASEQHIDKGEAERGMMDSVPSQRLALPFLAAHAAQRALAIAPLQKRYQLTIDRRTQEALERVAHLAATQLGPRISVAIVMADAHNGDVIADVGSAGFFDSTRAGWVDMTRAVRSPGSTLKPFIYGLAFEEGLVAQETIIEDRPSNFSGYRPRNFDLAYQGDVSIRTALQMSLNVPAVHLLDSVGPAKLTTRFRQAGIEMALPRFERPGLAIALGGAGISLYDLVQLYTAFPNLGEVTSLGNLPGPRQRSRLLESAASWQVSDMLGGITPPEGARRQGIAYKTGTSYGYRDAWSVGFDGRHVIGVWVGRPDGAPVPGLAGYQSAAPILFEAFAKSGVAILSLPRPPTGAFRSSYSDLPITLRRFATGKEELQERPLAEPAPQIIFPPQGARVERIEGGLNTIALKLQGGRAPFRWLANGRAFDGVSRRRTMTWVPTGAGFSTLTVIDAAGRSDSVKLFVE